MRVRRTTGAIVALLALVGAAACSGSGGDDATAKAVPFVAVDTKSTSPTDQAIAKNQAVLRTTPDDPAAQLALAQAFLQKARETADPSLYTNAGKLLDRLDDQVEPSAPVLIAEGTLALARHEFAEGLALGTKALALAPGNEAALGILVDANNELGRYPAALDASQEMVDAKPNLASLSRASYARELRGDLDGAVLAMTQAITAGGSAGGENLAYVQVLLGNLLLTRGDLTEANRAYDTALRYFPGYPAAKAGKARVLVAQERFGEAGDLLAEVVEVQPLAEYAIAEGDAYAAAGRRADAEQAYDLVAVIARLYEANGVNVDLEIALFDADHHPGAAAVAKARTALEERPSILGHDVLAWNLYRTKQYAAAAKESKLALATGSQDPLLQFHAAAIAQANGDTAAAKEHLTAVLDTNPRFSADLLDDITKLAKQLGLTVPPPGTCTGCG